MSEAFSQDFCSVVPVGLGGRIIAGQRIAPCLVRIDLGVLTIARMRGGEAVAQVPVAGLEIATPPMLRKVGTSAVLRIDGELLAVEFDTVYTRRKAAGSSGIGGVLRRGFSISAVTDAPKALKLGRELTRTFTTALLAIGAVDTSAAAS